MMNIIHTTLPMCAQREKTIFKCKDDCTLTKHTQRWTYSSKEKNWVLCHIPCAAYSHFAEFFLLNTFLDQKCFWTKKYEADIFFLTKHFLDIRFLGQNIIKHFIIQPFFITNFWTNNVSGPDNVGPQICTKHSLSKNFIWQEHF